MSGIVKIGLIGIPVETVFVTDWHRSIPYTKYIPGITEESRKGIISIAAKKGIQIDDLGELGMGDIYSPGFNTRRIGHEGINVFHIGKLKDVTPRIFEKKRKEVLDIAHKYDIFFATGPSHASGMLLYEKNDIVNRLDYHSDFGDFGPDNTIITYANYMDWVNTHMPGLQVTNYFTRYFSSSRKVVGKLSTDAIGKRAAYANHFDIDVDCFAPSFMIQSLYRHHNGINEVTPKDVIEMMKKSNFMHSPFKIGIWEYRAYDDLQNNGLEFITDAAICIAQLKKSGQKSNHAQYLPASFS